MSSEVARTRPTHALPDGRSEHTRYRSMGDVIYFPQPEPVALNPRTRRAIERLFRAEDREAQRRIRLYAGGR